MTRRERTNFWLIVCCLALIVNIALRFFFR